MATLLKEYSNVIDKYGRATADNFKRQPRLLYKRCNEAETLMEKRDNGFSIMLKGNLLQYYSDYLIVQNLCRAELEEALKSQFET